MAEVSLPKNKAQRPPWLDEYDILGKIGEGTYGLVYLAKNKDRPRGGNRTAIKKFKQSKEGDGVSPTAIREIMLLRECNHDNVVRLVKVHINNFDMSLYLAFDYAEHDLYEIIRHHREKLLFPIREYTVKSLLWQILNGLNYLHSNWIIHRDLKPSNILVTGNEGEEPGLVKIADFGLARIFQAPLKALWDNGVVVTIWYRSPELLLGAKHYTCAVDMWAVGCIFAELITLKPLFQGVEDKAMANPVQVDQLDKIFRNLGTPTVDRWPSLPYLPHWFNNRSNIQSHRYDPVPLSSILQLPPNSPSLDLLMRMLEYDPLKRITAAQALEHEYFQLDPLPGKNALMGGHMGDKPVMYPNRPVELSSDFEGLQTAAQGQSGSLPLGASGKVISSGHLPPGTQQRHGASILGVPGQAVPGGGASRAGLTQQQQQQQMRMRERSLAGHPLHQPPTKSRRL